jgi:tetratricopeptide (TPR) repeat protein
MNKLISAALVVCAVSIATPEARAERSTASDASNSAAARAWQASYSAEAAGNYDAALDALDQLPGALGRGYTANYRRGWLHYCLGRHADSIAAYSSAIAAEPDAVEARVALLLPLMAASKWRELIKVAHDVLKRDPQNYLALQRMAYAQYNSQRFPEAEQTYRRVVKLYPSDLDTRAALGWAVLRMGKQPEAAELFRAVLELSPKHASASSGLQAAAARSGGRSY